MLPKSLSLPAGLVSGTVDGGAIGRYVALCLQAVTGAKGRDQVKMPLLPRVSNMPLFNGSIFSLRASSLQGQILEFAARCGSVFVVRPGLLAREVVVCGDPGLAEAILKDETDAWQHPPPDAVFQDMWSILEKRQAAHDQGQDGQSAAPLTHLYDSSDRGREVRRAAVRLVSGEDFRSFMNQELDKRMAALFDEWELPLIHLNKEKTQAEKDRTAAYEKSTGRKMPSWADTLREDKIRDTWVDDFPRHIKSWHFSTVAHVLFGEHLCTQTEMLANQEEKQRPLEAVIERAIKGWDRLEHHWPYWRHLPSGMYSKLEEDLKELEQRVRDYVNLHRFYRRKGKDGAVITKNGQSFLNLLLDSPQFHIKSSAPDDEPAAATSPAPRRPGTIRVVKAGESASGEEAGDDASEGEGEEGPVPAFDGARVEMSVSEVVLMLLQLHRHIHLPAIKGLTTTMWVTAGTPHLQFQTVEGTRKYIFQKKSKNPAYPQVKGAADTAGNNTDTDSNGRDPFIARKDDGESIRMATFAPPPPEASASTSADDLPNPSPAPRPATDHPAGASRSFSSSARTEDVGENKTDESLPDETADEETTETEGPELLRAKERRVNEEREGEGQGANESVDESEEGLDVLELPSSVFVGYVVQEAMRLLPPTAFISRTCSRNVRYKDLKFAEGTEVLVSPQLLHHHPSYWAYATHFWPYRWVPPSLKWFFDEQTIPYYHFGEAKSHFKEELVRMVGSGEANALNCASIPFGEGPRMCPAVGEYLARSFIQTFMAKATKRFMFHLENEEGPPQAGSFTLSVRLKDLLSEKEEDALVSRMRHQYSARPNPEEDFEFNRAFLENPLDPRRPEKALKRAKRLARMNRFFQMTSPRNEFVDVWFSKGL